MQRIDRPDYYDGRSNGTVIAGHFHEPDSYITNRPTGMDDWLITYTLGGEGFVHTPSGERLCKPGDVALLRPGTPHQYGTSKGTVWHFVWAHFAPADIEANLLPMEDLFLHKLESVSAQKRVYRAFNRILSDSRERGKYWHELSVNALREILLLLAQRIGHKLDARIEEALHYLSRHMREPIRIEALARSIGLSPSRLSHLFKASTGQSIVDTLNRMRINQAALLLQHTDRTAAEVSFDVGFANYNHFIRQFRKWYGVSPSTFRKA